jgi:NAD(P)-dependent dehydrogenase (short-subunit alcohol dehydrogenase family)
MIRLDDQVAISTGSGRGLGAAYARLLAERGARVVVHDAGVNTILRLLRVRLWRN